MSARSSTRTCSYACSTTPNRRSRGGAEAPPLVFEAIESCRQHQISFWDALIVRAAHGAGCETLLTEDLNHGQVIDGVRVENLFA